MELEFLVLFATNSYVASLVYSLCTWGRLTFFLNILFICQKIVDMVDLYGQAI